MNIQEKLCAKLRNREARVVVIGLGYVGFPLLMAFAEAGYDAIGIDVDTEKVRKINDGRSPVDGLASTELASSMGKTNLPFLGPNHTNGKAPVYRTAAARATTDFSVLRECDAVSICVPTPLNKVGEPDLSFIVAVAREIQHYLHKGMVVVLESTTYPGTTTEILLAELQHNEKCIQVGQDFFLAYSPERIDPGRADWTVVNTPKVIGGTTPACLEVAVAYYEPAVGPLITVSSTETAELVKLFENTFRSVNIGLVNELLIMCDKLGLDAWKVIDAAATKPFGFMRFTPGPGLGGHCIPIDPHYLSWKLRSLDYTARFIDLASQVNTEMPRFWVHKIQDALNDNFMSTRGSRILILGVAYKKNVADIRESPAIDIILMLQHKGAEVRYHDPYVATLEHHGLQLACRGSDKRDCASRLCCRCDGS